MKNSIYGNINLEDDLVIIGPSYIKKEIIKENNLNYNIKYIDINELKEKWLYKYKKGILVYIDNKYNLLPEIGNYILKSLYNVDINKNYNSEKLNFLVEIKKDLISQNYISFEDNFKKYLVDKKILFLNGDYDNLTFHIIEEIKKNNDIKVVQRVKKERKNISIHEFSNIDEEIIFVSEEIIKLLEKGIDINNIKINILDDVYKAPINKIFDFYHIPFSINKKNKLFYLDDIKKFLNNINDDDLISSLNNILNDLNIEEKVKVELVSILNNYSSYKVIGDIREELIFDLKNKDFSIDKYTNVISEIDYHNSFLLDDFYVFVLGFNQDKIPLIYKDDEYLSDAELMEIEGNTSFIKNINEKEQLTFFINFNKNLIISYKLSSDFMDFSPSNYIKNLSNTMDINIIKDKYNYDNEKINKLLLASRLDNYLKYNFVSDDLEDLYSSYSDTNYKEYDNNYNGIEYDTIKKQLADKINLSFSNTNTFFRCKFRFLLDVIYKLAPNIDTVSQKIGILFHEVLCIVYRDNRYDYDNIINDVISKMYENPTIKDNYYIGKYKVALLKLINILNAELEKTSYQNTYFEQWFSIDKKDDLQINIVGKIDKILTLKDNDNTYVIVVDYKTGTLHNDFNKVIYGLDMQLLYYLYLIKNTSIIANPKFTGMYLQSIMTEVLTSQKNKKYEDLILDNMRLNGYTTSNVSKLHDIDHGYEENSYIKSLRLKNDGTFYAYSKVLDDETIEKLLAIVSEKIDEVIHSIKKSDFAINPKKIGDNNIGCEYCPFGDICYKTDNNIVELKEYKNMEFLGGEDNDTN